MIYESVSLVWARLQVNKVPLVWDHLAVGWAMETVEGPEQVSVIWQVSRTSRSCKTL